MLDKKAFGGIMALIVDIQKAFDTIDWSFLLDVLDGFVLSLQFRDWILKILSTCQISVMINGKTSSYFRCSQRVQHGDGLLSPIHYCLAEEFLSRSLIRESS